MTPEEKAAAIYLGATLGAIAAGLVTFGIIYYLRETIKLAIVFAVMVGVVGGSWAFCAGFDRFQGWYVRRAKRKEAGE